jgi:hypothetical protein
MVDALALNANNITKIGIGVIIALVVIGVVLSLIITAIIGRVIILLVVIGLGVWVWVQRDSIQDKLDKHQCPKSESFFGISIDANKYCRQLQKHT